MGRSLRRSHALGWRIIHQGHVTQRNDYTFHNSIVRFGASLAPASWLWLTFGADVHFYAMDYHATSTINNTETTATPQAEWTEARFNAGGGVRIGDLTISIRSQ